MLSLSAGSVRALEFMPFSAVRTVAEALDQIEATGARSIGLVVDLLHLVRGGGDAAALHTVPAELVAYAQVCDAPARSPVGSPDLAALAHEARHERLVPGDGELDLRGLVAALPAGTPLTVEVQSDALTAQLPPLDRARHLRERTLDALRPPSPTHPDQERPRPRPRAPSSPAAAPASAGPSASTCAPTAGRWSRPTCTRPPTDCPWT